MKIRNGFVSNSSSSSFICISNKGGVERPILRNNVLKIPLDSYGETDFNSSYGKIFDFSSKLNFLYLQILSRNDNKYYLMFRKALVEALSPSMIEENLYFDDDSSNNEIPNAVYGSLDHGAILEDGEFKAIFKNTQTIIDFLFNDDSYIQIVRD